MREGEDDGAGGRRGSAGLTRSVGLAAALGALTLSAASAGAVENPPSAPAVAPWSQGVHYRIEATLDEETDVLSGLARIRYVNNSPDTLRRFYVHQHLNAFRPNSAWARADLERGIRTFQDLGPDEHAFERIRRAEIDGRPAQPFYPHAPDSTIAAFELARSLAPGDSITVEIRWDARLSTVPRRQGRRGRSFDFAQWYPRVVVYDLEGWRDHPLYRQGEFYGEYATYDVTLDVRADQVLGSTGVPVQGDPGWEGAAAPGTGPVTYQRTWYGAVDGPPCVERAGIRSCGIPGPAGAGPGRAEELGLLDGEAEEGRKRVRWYAEAVHHFAWSASPEYIYEQGRFEDVAIHVLYRPGDEESWGDGVALERTVTSLAFMDSVFGDYSYPQLTNLHRIEGGGTEFPMVIMDGSASLGLILHETAHQYAHGILGNNEWYEGWLDEGMASFLGSWFSEWRGAGRSAWLGAEASVLTLELRGHSQPVTYPAEDYPEYGVYGTMIYTKGSLIFRMLRDLAGEEAFVEVLRTYYDRYELSHVDGDAFQAVAEEVLRRDLDWFFGQWLHATGWVDYALEDVAVEETGEGGWSVSFDVERRGEMVMPVPVRVEGTDGEAKDTTIDGTGFRPDVRIETSFRPVRVELDPDGAILDWNGLNDVWVDGFLARGGVERELSRPLDGMTAYRDRMTADFLPLGWANDPGGIVAGFQRRTGYMGRMHRSLLRVGLPGFEAFDRGGGAQSFDWGSVYYRVEDPIWRGEPRFGTRFEAMAGEGRTFARLDWERDVSRLPLSGVRRSARAYLLYAGVEDPAYLPRGRWALRESLSGETGIGYGQLWPTDRGEVGVDLETGLGFSTRPDKWLRASGELHWERETASGWSQRLRLFGGVAIGSGEEEEGWSGGAVPPERRFGLSGAGPYETLSDPWARSRGGLLAEEAHHPGDGNLRGFDRSLMVDRVVSLGGEVRTSRLEAGPLEVGADFFLEGAWVPELVDLADGALFGDGTGELEVLLEENALLFDAGAGLVVGWAGSPLALRVDVPFFVSDPGYARSARDEEIGLRWAISVVGR